MNYEQIVGARYHIYNSLFLNLPFRDILKTGTLLPLMQQYCDEGFEKGDSADQIIKRFFDDLLPSTRMEERFDLLFRFIQYVERQVALFDSVEDSAFEQVNDTKGRGTVSAMLLRSRYDNKNLQLKERLEKFSVRVVLTAHPTQFYPGTVLGILTDLENSIRTNDLVQIDLLLQQLGKTRFINETKPTPFDEAVSLCWYLENVFYHAIPSIVNNLAQSLDIDIAEWNNDKLFVVGFWPGGDRDGNPFVTSEVTMKVATRLQETLFRCYARDIRLLRRRLTFQGIDRMVTEIERKINNFLTDRRSSYSHATDLLNDLVDVRKKLLSEHDGLFLDLLNSFITRVKVFGIHFACLDIRQDSRKHDQVWIAILETLSKEKKAIGSEEFLSKNENERIEYLLNFKTNPLFLSLQDDFADETLKTILAIGEVQARNGQSGCHRYVISNCQSALHIIEVYVLNKLLIGEGDLLNLDIVPLFETIDDLSQAPLIMENLYSIPEYRTHLTHRDNRQTIMLGFSDGTKDGGYLRANWSIYRAKEKLTEISIRFGIEVIFFDGRGGPPARGGGNTHDFYASLGSGIAQEEVQITIQGQTISSNFGKPVSCRFNLEQLLSAGIENSVFKKEESDLTPEDKALLDDLAEAGYHCYLDLKNDPRFVPYLEKITPLSFFGDTNIGSRPVKRNSSEGLKFEDLRAIPFVASWAMMKQNIPGFYGVGSALQKMYNQGNGDKLKELYRRSLFFRTLLGNSMMSLTKTYYKATTYLKDDTEFGDFWRKMYDEFLLSRKMILEVTGLGELMGNNPVILDSVRHRERIVLPLIAIQQYALMHLRTTEGKSNPHELKFRKLVLRSMFGIINAARNSA